MIFGHIDAPEFEHAYAPQIRRAIDYCRKTDVSGKSNELMKRRWSGLSGVALFLHIQTEKKGKNVYKL